MPITPITKYTKYLVIGVIALIVGLGVGYAITAYLISPVAMAPPEKIFYIVAAEWTFGLYDENFSKIDRIVVNKGDRVTLVIMLEPFVPHDLYEEVEETFIEWAIKQGLITSKEDFEKYHEEAEETLEKEVFGAHFIPHGAAIRGYEDKVDVRPVRGTPVVISFIADKAGSFDIYCQIECGWGHAFMVLEKAFVVMG